MSSLIERIESLRKEGEEICKKTPLMTSISFNVPEVDSAEEIEEAAAHFGRKGYFESDGYFRLYVPCYGPGNQSINIHIRSKDKFTVKTEYIKE